MSERRRATVVCVSCGRELSGVRVETEDPSDAGWRVRAHRVDARGGPWCDGNFWPEAAIIRAHQEAQK